MENPIESDLRDILSTGDAQEIKEFISNYSFNQFNDETLISAFNFCFVDGKKDFPKYKRDLQDFAGKILKQYSEKPRANTYIANSIFQAHLNKMIVTAINSAEENDNIALFVKACGASKKIIAEGDGINKLEIPFFSKMISLITDAPKPNNEMTNILYNLALDFFCEGDMQKLAQEGIAANSKEVVEFILSQEDLVDLLDPNAVESAKKMWGLDEMSVPMQISSTSTSLLSPPQAAI